MKKLVGLLIVVALFTGLFYSCAEKKVVDKRELVKELVDKEEFQQAKVMLIGLRGQYPNDQTLTDLAKHVDEKIAEGFYKQYWEEAEKGGGHDDWIKAMIKIKERENINKEMVADWIKKAAEKCIDAGAKNLNDGLLLGLLDKLVQRYQVITHHDRLMYITIFVKEGRFPLKEWKDTFLTKYSELMDVDTEEFLGWPRPEKK
ncbi:MAG: hypothetical protein ACOX2F_03270 [bacterium]